MLVSAGYDAHRDDPLADVRGDRGGLRGDDAVDARLRRETLEAPVGCVLEGGYALGALARSVAATLEALQEPVALVSERLGRVRRRRVGGAPVRWQREARERLAPWWPALA